MKKILIMMFSLSLALGASAQKHVFHAPRTRVFIAPSYSYRLGFGYPYFNYPYLGYPYFGYGYPLYNSRSIPYRLDGQIQGIKTEYKYKIKAARQDKSITKVQRKQQILSLKSERAKDINNAEMNFHRQRINSMQKMNNPNQMDNQQGTNNQQGENNQSQGSGNNQ